MAPWTHTYLSPQSERRMCCASREPAQNFTQYIDTAAGSGEYNPLTLEEHWNGEHMRDVRLRMMAGEELPECEVCNNKLLNTNVYRNHFWGFFANHYDDIWKTTDETGYTTMRPVSWDYRFSNICNFKCRMCGDMLSSSWESEKRQNSVNLDNATHSWMTLENKTKIKDFTESVVEKEFSRAVEEHRIQEIYWVGGEPLMFEQHWKYMTRIIELGDGPNMYARYNTNLSHIEYKGQHLWTDILNHIRDWQICASIDGTGAIGEYIRTGLNYNQWRENYQIGIGYAKPEQMRLDFTLTTPGLFELKNMFDLSVETNTKILVKVCFAFSPDIMMCPLMLPHNLLDPIIDDALDYMKPKATTLQLELINVLEHLKTRKDFSQEWPDNYLQGQIEGKRRIKEIEKWRKDMLLLEDILDNDKTIKQWWTNIPWTGTWPKSPVQQQRK